MVEFAFAQRQDIGTQFQALPVEFGEADAVALFKSRAALAFLECLHPEGLGEAAD